MSNNHLTELFRKLNKAVHLKRLAQCFTCRKLLINGKLLLL